MQPFCIPEASTKTNVMRLLLKHCSRITWRFLGVLLIFVSSVASIQAHPPTGIVVDRTGVVYFTDLETVWKLETNGNLSIFRAGMSGRHVHELAIDTNNNLLGADLSFESQKWVSDVWKMTPDGKLTYLVEPTTNPPRGASLFLDRAGNMYLVEQNNQTKKQTLLLKRTPDGQVTTLAGGPHGNRDGKGPEARLGGVGGLVVAEDGSLYLTDGTSLRKVSSDGMVTTIAKDLARRTSEDIAMLFGKNDGMLSGLTLGPNDTFYVADAGNQRLLKVGPSGTMEVVYRGDGIYYPNGVAVSASGDIYALEVGYKPPSTWLPARVRKISSTGQSSIVATSGQPTVAPTPIVQLDEARLRRIDPGKVLLAATGLGLLGIGVFGLTWKRKRQ